MNIKLIIKLVGLYGVIGLGGIIAFAEYSLYGDNTSKIGWTLISFGAFCWFAKFFLIPILKKLKIL